jgi:hypothetical protein
MTDFASFSTGLTSFLPEPAWEPAWAPAPEVHLHTASARRSGVRPAPSRSASSLASAVHQLVESLSERRVPHLDSLRERLQQVEGSWALRELAHALRAVHDAAGAVDFLACRGAQAQAEAFRAQGEAVRAAARRLGSACMVFVGKQASDAAVARLLWLELQNEYRGLEKRVRRGLEWMVDMEHELDARKDATTAEVSQRALQELARRGQALEHRLHLARAFCGAARAARSLGAQVAEQRAALGTVLQEKLRPRGVELQQKLQPLLDAAGQRAVQPAELLAAIDARHQLQVVLTEAGAELMQLESLHKELSAQLAWLQQKAQQASAPSVA